MGNVREHPAPKSAVIGNLYRGDRVTLLRRERGWFFVECPNGQRGWTHNLLYRKSAETLSFATKESEKTIMILNDETGSIHRAPSPKADIIDMLSRGDRVSVIGRRGDWSAIQLENGHIGWVHNNLLISTTPPLPMEDLPMNRLTAIRTVVYSDTEERVMFELTGFFPPNTYTMEGDQLGVVCVFPETLADESIPRHIKNVGRFVQDIRLSSDETTKTRVIIMLSQQHDYDIGQIFYKEENIYLLTIHKM